MFKKIFSYLIPINIYTQKSIINKSIEVTWANGKLVLDTENTNYSYGSLQRILRKGLVFIGFEKIKSMQEILILGVAGGSVIKTLRDEIGFRGKITGVEIDPEIIKIANQYFELNKTENLELIIDNAAEFVEETTKKYDLIVIDIFQDNFMPEFLFEGKFITSVLRILNKNGKIIFNTMVINQENKLRNIEFMSKFKMPYLVNKIRNIEKFNELIIIQKTIL